MASGKFHDNLQCVIHKNNINATINTTKATMLSYIYLRLESNRETRKNLYVTGKQKEYLNDVIIGTDIPLLLVHFQIRTDYKQYSTDDKKPKGNCKEKRRI